MPTPSRQVHLDFHTSELIEGIGRKFNKRQWQAALKAGRLNSITVFAKCHHGNCYYPTAVGTTHPHLTFDLMGRQIEASHEIGVRAPIYITVGWSARDSAAHPEWCVRDRSGNIVSCNVDRNAKPSDRRPVCSWDFLCPSGGYKQHVLDLTREICSRYPVDGFFYDICGLTWPICFCADCLAGMKARGLDPADEAQAREYSAVKWTAFMSGCREVTLRHHPEATAFFNGTAETETPEAIQALNTHFELEDLPTTWGGYDKFPLRSKYFARYGKDMLAMSGKFHTSWGEFGGFKHPDAIKFEAACMIGFGARCSFGDQLHPSGEMDMATYRNLGAAYSYVKKIEPYGLGGTPFANLGIFLSGQSHDRGVANMLMEQQIDFEVAEPADDLTRFDALILTGGRMLNRESAACLSRFVEAGGGLLVLGESALEAATDSVLLDIGAKYLGPAAFDCDYLVAGREIGRGLVASPFLNYTAAPRFKATRAKVLARIHEPYFSRTYEHYCSHQNTPYRLEAAEQAGVFQLGKIVSLAHPLGAMYLEHGMRLHRQLFMHALRRVYRKQTLAAKLPSSGRVNLVHQPERRRYVAHLFHAAPLQRGRCLVIEDMVPLRDVPVSLRVPQPIRRVSLPLAKKTLRAKKVAGAMCVTIPEMTGHQIVVFDY